MMAAAACGPPRRSRSAVNGPGGEAGALPAWVQADDGVEVDDPACRGSATLT